MTETVPLTHTVFPQIHVESDGGWIFGDIGELQWQIIRSYTSSSFVNDPRIINVTGCFTVEQ